MISIALITYNGEKYLREQLDSILSQSIQDFELVISDDCSTDSTLSILREYAQKDARIKLSVNEKNMGFLKNIKKTIMSCNGEYIALSDQDDIWEKEHLAILYSKIGDNLLVCGDTLLVDRDNNSLEIRFSRPWGMDINTLKNNDEILLRLLIMNNIYQGAAMMFHRNLTTIALPLSNETRCHDIWFALCAMALNKFVYVPTVVIRHRSHFGSITLGVGAREWWSRTDLPTFLEKGLEYRLEALPNLSKNSKRIIKQSMEFFKNKKSRIKRYKAVVFWVRNYRVLYATNSKNKFLIRFYREFVPGRLRRILGKIKRMATTQQKRGSND